MKHIRAILSVLSAIAVVLAFSQIRNVPDTLSAYNQYSALSSADLIAKSELYAADPAKADSTLLCLSVVANRYYEATGDKAQIPYAVQAFSNLGNLYMGRYHDYRKAYENFMMALQIAEENEVSDVLPSVYLGLSNLWQVNKFTMGDTPRKVVNWLKKSFEAAVRAGDDGIMPIIIASICSQQQYDTSWGPFSKEIATFKKHKVADGVPLKDFGRHLVAGMEKGFKGDVAEADAELAKANAGIGDVPFRECYVMMSNRVASIINDRQGMTDKAVNLLKNNVSIARDGYDDYLMASYKALYDVYDKAGLADSAARYRYLYLDTKERMLEKSHVNDIKEMDFLSQIDKIDSEVKELSAKRRNQSRMILIMVCVIIVIAIILFATVRSYSVLKKSHRRLYEQNVEGLKTEEQHREMRRQWQKEREELMARVDAKAEEDAEAKEKYKSNPLDSEDMARIYANILDVMENSDEIYRAGFTLDRLSELVGSHYRYVSQAINERYGNNFNSMLNEYRIREVCRRMHLPDAGNYTIESFAAGVGFKSRTSFANLFKKTVGLTPTEYVRLAQNK